MNGQKTLNKTINEVWEQRYVVPLYQRNFAWGEDEIGQLLQDVYDHSPLAGGNAADHYYLGSLILLQRRDGSWEVIDGQQRLTALHMICRYLGILLSPRLMFDSRPEVERFFNGLFNTDVKEFLEKSKSGDNTKVVSLVEALDIIDKYKIRINEKETSSLKKFSYEDCKVFSEYLKNNVILVCTPLPENTDVAAYFEIMNNRGEQLQSHEILKALLIKELKKMEERQLFAQIWDACSQMERPIQQSLKELRKAGVFGENYDSLELDKIKVDGQKEVEEPFTIDQILDSGFRYDMIEEDTDEVDIKYRSIIDFPNFLMHVLGLYVKEHEKKQKMEHEQGKEHDNEKEQDNKVTVPLNSDNIPVKKPEYIADSMDFVKHLLRVRTLFDRYVVKMHGDDENELKWRLSRPYRYTYKGIDQLKYALTESIDDDEYEELESLNDRLIKQQSMLQVSFRNRKYKTWLFDYLEWLLTDSGFEERSKRVEFLDTWIRNYYHQMCNGWKNDKEILKAGTETPHFLFNFIDYLYWLEANLPDSDKTLTKGLKFDFSFRNYNSVEHHLPQSYVSEKKDWIGNLCLISRKKNSSLNAKSPSEKARNSVNLQPKREIMYHLTTTPDENGATGWNDRHIEAHHEEVVRLLDRAEELLCAPDDK